MNRKEIEKRIIENYQNDEQAMILIFTQWCINHNLDPIEIYGKAYPDQVENQVLKEMMENTVSKENSEEISDDILFQVLDLFGNHDLAFIVQEEIEKRDRK